MSTGPRKGRGRGILLLWGLLAILAAAGGINGLAQSEGPASGSTSIRPLLVSLWAAGFFKRNEAVESEIGNNSYSFFDRNSPKPPGGVRGLGCFSRRPDGADIIYLRRELFARFEVGLEGVVIHPGGPDRAMPVLVHEICHDLWTNVLDEGERAAFAREGWDFIEEYRRALTPEDRRLFLLRAGDDASDAATLKSYAGIDWIVATFPPRSLRGHELFAWLAERLFVTKARIPRRLGKYYACILDDKVLGPGLPDDH